MLKLYGFVKVDSTFIERYTRIDRNHPKFQTVLDLISRSRFKGKCDTSPPYAISHELNFHLGDGQLAHLDYYEGALWWKAVYCASVDLELGNILDAILLSETQQQYSMKIGMY